MNLLIAHEEEEGSEDGDLSVEEAQEVKNHGGHRQCGGSIAIHLGILGKGNNEIEGHCRGEGSGGND